MLQESPLRPPTLGVTVPADPLGKRSRAEAERFQVSASMTSASGCPTRMVARSTWTTRDACGHTITKLQTVLNKKRYYQHQPTGRFNDNTLAAVNAYERDNNPPTDRHLNIETAKSLGLYVK